MQICTIIIPTHKSTRKFKRMIRYECDWCHTIYDMKYGQRSCRPTQFCSRNCSSESSKKIQNGILYKNRRDLFVARFGAESPTQNIDTLNKVKRTNIERYGVEWVMQHSEIREKSLKTLLNHYGVTNPAQLDHVKLALNSIEVCQKRHETMKRNGTYGKSKVEDKLYDILCEKFGAEDIERQVLIPGTRWCIDFYVKSTGVYIQFDGVYWHGLDRPIEVIKEFKHSRDVVIYKKWLTDRTQDVWFLEHQKRLVSLTDVEFKHKNSCIIERISK